MKKTAVILFNLGGPDRLSSVKPFLFNLFSDKAILTLPNPFRYLLAKFIAARREKEAREIYQQLGGASPLLKNTLEQATALKKRLGKNYSVHVVMRYWHPRASHVWGEVLEEAPDEILMIPLYPQYSTTTTESSHKEWLKTKPSTAAPLPIKEICCYPDLGEFIEAMAEMIRPHLPENLSEHRLLLTAHGLPKKIVDLGDPYVTQVEKTAEALLKKLDRPDLEAVVCYQSRVGPLAWVEPYTDEEILKGSRSQKHLIVVPIAFVSEHSETLVELDRQYRELALKNGALSYTRIKTVSTHPLFIEGLARLIQTLSQETSTQGVFSEGLCSKACRKCPRPTLLPRQEEMKNARMAL